MLLGGIGMNNKAVILTASLLCLSLLPGCQKEKQEDTVKVTPKIVKAQSVQQQSLTDGLTYIGVIKAKDTKNYSFLMSGKIAKINVEKGQKFKKGDVLAVMDTKTLQYSADIGGNTSETAKATLDKTVNTYDTNIATAKTSIETLNTSIAAAENAIKAGQESIDANQVALNAAENALNRLKQKLSDAKALNDAGGVSDSDVKDLETSLVTQQANYDTKVADLNSAKAELESKKAEVSALYDKRKTAQNTLDNLYVSKEKDVKAAQAAVSSANISNDITQKNINDATIKADADGYVMELPYKEGEVISAGYPVVVAKSTDMVVSVGVSDKDISKVKIGGKAVVKNGVVGNIVTVAQYPNEDTRTYAVDISVPADKFTIGETVNVKIVTGNATGCYVPINAVFNLDGVDYVYAINTDNKVYKKQVTRGSIDGDKVEVKIDDPTATIITEGIKSLRENDTVKVEGE